MSRLFLLGVLSGLALAVAITASVLAGLGAGEAAERVLASKPRASELTAIARDAGTRQARAGDAPARASRAAPDRRPSPRSCRRIVIDPGHDARPNLGTEPVGPGARARKTKDGGGPVGVATGREAHAVNLAVSLGLRERLVERGYCVTMTRAAASSRPSRGNVARAGIANKARATLFLRIHVDASPSQARRGSAVLYPAYDRRWTADILPQSKRAARVIQRAGAGARRARPGQLPARRHHGVQLGGRALGAGGRWIPDQPAGRSAALGVHLSAPRGGGPHARC